MDPENKQEKAAGKKKKNFYPTQRDLKAVRWLCEQGIASVENLWRAVYKGPESKSSKYAEERLRGLCQLGLIKRVRVFGSGVTNYVPTHRGLNYLANLSDNAPQRRVPVPGIPRGISVATYRHRIDLNACRTHIQNNPRVTIWVNDRSIPSYAKQYLDHDTQRFLGRARPDAYFLFEGVRWFLECELTQKSKKSYESKKEKYHSMNYLYDIRGVIFVVPNESLRGILSRNFEDAHFLFQIFTLAELKSGDALQYLEKVFRADKRREEEKIETDRQELRSLQASLESKKSELKTLEMKLSEQEKIYVKDREALREYSQKKLFKLESKEKSLESAESKSKATLWEFERSRNEMVKTISSIESQIQNIRKKLPENS